MTHAGLGSAKPGAHALKYDAFATGVVPSSGSLGGGTEVKVTGSFGEFPDGFTIPNEWFKNRRQHTVSATMCSSAQPCLNYFEGYYRGGGHQCKARHGARWIAWQANNEQCTIS